MGLLTVSEFVRGHGSWSSRFINLQAWAVVLFVNAILLPYLGSTVPFSLVSNGPWWAMVPLFFLVMDLGEYLFHRAQHAIPVLWRLHSLHHSDEEMNATTTQRHFWGDALLKQLSIWPLAAMIVQPTPLATTLYGCVAIWHYVSHSALDLNFGRWSWLINSPAYHRRHHSSLPEHYDSNFAGLFPIFDVIAGSYYKPEGYPPTGLDERPRHILDIVFWPVSRGRRNLDRLEDQLAKPL
jgi:sterol desaturase/sphingolipid hydroxylase (fatty acid hydroxylase superfamily)